MNLYKRELKQNTKVFLFWCAGLAFLIFAGMTEFLGVSSSQGGDIAALMDRFPKVVLAVFGMSRVNLQSLGGYYSVLQFYIQICGIVYAIFLGCNAVNREFVDKTYEFIFTKPRSRASILGQKISAGVTCLVGFFASAYLFSVLSVPLLKLQGSAVVEMLLFQIGAFLVCLLFFSLAVCVSSFSKKSENGSRYSYLAFMVAFVCSVLYDSLENATIFKYFSPIRFFEASDILMKKFDIVLGGICLITSVVLLVLGVVWFSRRDLQAI